MSRITRPPQGNTYRITGKGYVEGFFYVDGRRVARSLGSMASIDGPAKGRRLSAAQLDRRIQSLWDAKLEELRKGAADETTQTMPISSVFEAWRKEEAEVRASPHTLRLHRLCHEYYLELVGDHPLAEPVGTSSRLRYNLDHAAAFRQGLSAKRIAHGGKLTEKTLAVRTVNTYLARLSSALKFACERDWLERQPAIKRMRESKKRGRIRTATPDQLRTVLSMLNDRISTAPSDLRAYYYRLHRLLFFLLLGTGARRAEARTLPRKNVDLDQRSILLDDTKTGEPRIVRIPRYLQSELERHFEDNPKSVLVFEHPKNRGKPAWRHDSSMTTTFLRLMKSCGLQGAFKALHGYRATFATIGLNYVGVDPASMQAQLGHAEFSTTEAHYLGEMKEGQLRMVDAMEAAYFDDLFGGNPGGKLQRADGKIPSASPQVVN